jgi:hypothetical protein
VAWKVLFASVPAFLQFKLNTLAIPTLLGGRGQPTGGSLTGNQCETIIPMRATMPSFPCYVLPYFHWYYCCVLCICLFCLVSHVFRGFHEDGFVSGRRAARSIGKKEEAQVPLYESPENLVPPPHPPSFPPATISRLFNTRAQANT